jgi:hypothetical protein
MLNAEGERMWAYVMVVIMRVVDDVAAEPEMADSESDDKG